MTSHSAAQIRPIYCVDALAGSGKTARALEWAVSHCKSGNNVCVVQPTTALINESLDRLKKLDCGQIQIDSIHAGADDGEGVVNRIQNVLKRIQSPNGTLLFITHEAFCRLPYWHRSDRWTLLVDEEINYPKTFSWNIPSSYKLVTEYLDVEEYNSLLFRILPRASITQNSFKEFVGSLPCDDVFRGLTDLFFHIRNKNCLTLIEKQCWERHRLGLAKSRGLKFTCVSILSPSICNGFEKVVFLSAMIYDSLMLKIWANSGVKMKSFDAIQSSISGSQHQRQGPTNIGYFPNDSWSIRSYNQLATHNGQSQRIIDTYREHIVQEFGPDPFLVYANKAECSGFRSTQAEILQGLPQGINQYRHFNNVAVLAAFNPIPASYPVFRSLGLTESDFVVGFNYLKSYQAILRTSLRNPTDTNAVNIVLPTKALAEWLAPKFSNSTLMEITGVPGILEKKAGRPKTGNALSAAERKAHSERKRNIAVWKECVHKYGIGNSYNNKGIIDPKNDHTHTISVQYFPTKRSLPMANMVESYSGTEELIELLKQWWQDEPTRKDARPLLSPALFHDESSRKSENVLFAWGIWIDIDGGDLLAKEFGALFPDTLTIAFNTFSGDGRYRVFIPTDQIMTPWVYKDIHRSLQSYVRSCGFRMKGDKIANPDLPICNWDPATMRANALFYLPCQPKTKKKKDAFFFRSKGRPLNVEQWLSNPRHRQDVRDVATSRSVFQASPNTPSHPSNVEPFIREYQSTPPGQGQRNKAFFKLGCQLRRLGKSFEEIESILVLADLDGSRRKKNAIRSVISSLKKYSSQRTASGRS